MGTVTGISISNQTILKNYQDDSKMIHKVDLSEFSPGTYTLEVRSCNVYGVGTLIIKE